MAETVKIEIDTGRHSMEPPQGTVEKLEHLFTLAGLTGDNVFKVRMAQKKKCTGITPTYHLSQRNKEGVTQILVKPTNNDSRWSYFIEGQHGFSNDDIHRRIAVAIAEESKNNNGAGEEEKHRKFVSTIVRNMGIEGLLSDSIKKMSHRSISKSDLLRIMGELDLNVAYMAFLKYLLKEGLIERRTRQSYSVIIPKKVEEPKITIQEGDDELVLSKRTIKKLGKLAAKADRYKEIQLELKVLEDKASELRVEASGLQRANEDFDMVMELLKGSENPEILDNSDIPAAEQTRTQEAEQL